MLHINRFIDKIKMLESKQAKDLTMSMRDAKDLHSDITKLLLVLQTLQTPDDVQEESEIQHVEITGGNFTDK